MIASNPVISSETSARIVALRFILMALVVFIHNDFTVENIAGNAVGENAVVFCQSPLGAWIQKLVSQGIARGAVPLFFLFAGYLQARKNDPYPVLLKKRARSLLIPFCLWMGIYAACFSGAKLLAAKFAPHLVAHSGSSAFPYSASEWFHNFLGYKLKADGTFSNPGFAIQFWFVRDLLILVVLSPVLRWFLATCPMFLFALSGMAFLTPFPVFVNSQALFFYLGGDVVRAAGFRLFRKGRCRYMAGNCRRVFSLVFRRRNLFCKAGAVAWLGCPVGLRSTFETFGIPCPLPENFCHPRLAGWILFFPFRHPRSHSKHGSPKDVDSFLPNEKRLPRVVRVFRRCVFRHYVGNGNWHRSETVRTCSFWPAQWW